ASGLDIKPMGRTREPDGGVDYIAWPRLPSIPFLVAIQVKHHHSASNRTGVRDVREFLGVLASSRSPFQFGILVTSTEFTMEARQFAETEKKLLRLRDRNDIARWIRGVMFGNEEWRELTHDIELSSSTTFRLPDTLTAWDFAAMNSNYIPTGISQGMVGEDGKSYQIQLMYPPDVFGPDGSLNTDSSFVFEDKSS
ncbi:MAG: restriction endonuclease, partial [Cyanobacteria bacterium J06635_15]